MLIGQNITKQKFIKIQKKKKKKKTDREHFFVNFRSTEGKIT